MGAVAKREFLMQRPQLCSCADWLSDALCAQGKFKPLKFTCKHRQLLLTDLFQCMAAAAAVSRCLVAAKILGWVANALTSAVVILTLGKLVLCCAHPLRNLCGIGSLNHRPFECSCSPLVASSKAASGTEQHGAGPVERAARQSWQSLASP